MKPALIIDIDGVLNPFDGWHEELVKDGYRFDQNAFTFYKPAHGGMLLDFAETHGFELVWGTFWNHRANEEFGPLIGLPQLPVIDVGSVADHYYDDWKYGSVQDWAWERPIAWLDDEHEFADRQDWARRFLQERRAPTKLVTVDPAVGLQLAHLDEIAEWAKQIQEAHS